MAVIIDGLGQPVNITVAASGVVVCPVASILTGGGGGGGGGVTDHGALTGLADDDHTQYHTDARGDARYSQLGHNHDHGNLTGLADDDHPQYLNTTRGDIRYALINHGHAASAVSVAASGFAGNLSPADTNVQLALATLNALDVSGSGAVAALTAATGEPMGHKDRTESVISFDNSTRIFTIAPVGATYEVWCAGTKYDLTTQSVTIPNTTGLYYISFDNTGSLQYQTTYFDWPTETPTSYVYWNQSTGKAEFFADERHGIVLDWQTHEYLHRTRGAAFATGFSVGGYTLGGTGDVAADAQVGVGNGTFFDEDLQVDVVTTTTPASGTWEQNLVFPAQIPMFRLQGTAWQKDAATVYPLRYQSGQRPQYNLLSAGSWSSVQADNGKYVVSWVTATNNLNEPVLAILGQGQYSSLNDAKSVAWDSLTLTNFPVFEFRPLYKLIFLTQTSMTNTPKASLAAIQDLRGSSSVGSGTVVSDHGLLAGLADDDHTQYALADGSRGAFDASGAAASASNVVQGNLNTHTALTTSAHGGIVASTDPRLTDARTPTAHAASHAATGSDAITIANTQVTGLGGAALLNVGTTASTVASGDDSRITGAVQATVVDAAGDLIVGTADNSVARLAMGSRGTVLTANASTITYSRVTTSGGGYAPAIDGPATTFALASTIPQWATLGNQGGPTSQRVVLVPIQLDEGITVTSIAFVSGTTPLAGGVNQWFGLADSTRTSLAYTVDDGSTAWGASTRKVLALTSPYMTAYRGRYYLILLVNAATPPSLRGLSTPSGGINFAAISANTGVTTPPAVGTALTAATAGTNTYYGEAI